MNRASEASWVPCNLCGSLDLTLLFTATRCARRVVRCRQCGLIFYNPQPPPAQAVAPYSRDYFSREFPDHLAAAQAHRAHQRLARIEREVDVGRLLDVGCGLGRFLAVAKQRGWKAMGLDVAEAAARAATATSEVPVLQGDLSMPRPAGVLPFDVVTMWDVLEHLWDPVGDLRRARSWLASRGLIVIQTQNANGVTYGWMRHRWEQFVDGHLYHFSSRTLQRALELAGFEEIRIEASDRFVPGDPAALKDPAAPRACFRDGLLGLLRQLRDSLYVRRGFDPFNIMVATARCPAGG